MNSTGYYFFSKISVALPMPSPCKYDFLIRSSLLSTSLKPVIPGNPSTKGMGI